MSACTSRFGRALCRSLGLLAVAAVVPVGSVVPARPAHAVSLVQRYYPEVRLRKLHLVRPDLIPYPVDFEVFC